MNSDDLILRSESYSPLTTKGSNLTAANFDDNNINIYKDLLALAFTEGVDAYSSSTEYDDTVNRFATYDGRTWQCIHYEPMTNITPSESAYWTEVFPAIMAHPKNQDTILDEGGDNEISAASIVAGLAVADATTDLGISSKTPTTFVVTSSTGANVTLPEATQKFAGLLGANDKVTLDNTSGTNSGDQSLASLGAEATANKVSTIDPDAVVADSFPTVQSVVDYVQSLLNTESFQAICSALDADLAVASTVGYFRVPYDIDISDINITVLTAPTDADITCDILADAVSILGTTELTIDDGETDSDDSAATPTLVTTQLTEGQIVTVDITQVGSTTAGKDLVFTMLASKS